MNITFEHEQLIVFTVILGSAVVIIVGLGLRVISIALKHEGEERLQLIGVGLGGIILGGGFFAHQLVKVIGRF